MELSATDTKLVFRFISYVRVSLNLCISDLHIDIDPLMTSNARSRTLMHGRTTTPTVGIAPGELIIEGDLRTHPIKQVQAGPYDWLCTSPVRGSQAPGDRELSAVQARLGKV